MSFRGGAGSQSMFVFFSSRRRHTRFDCDWSSDVCSSDLTWTRPPPQCGHPYYMHDAIYAQPGALRLATRGQGDLIDGAASRLSGMDRVLLSGIGTSWHATLVGELLFAHAGRLGHRVRAFHSFEFKSYWPDPDARTGVVVVSHRGSKRYSVEALAKARAGGGVGVAITGKGAEGLASADYVLRTVDQEHSAAHTVSYTCALVLVAPPGAAYARCVAVARVAKEIGAPLVALVQEDDREIAPLAAETIAIPPVNELLSPILTVVPLQLLTYHLALIRGVNPDTMRADEPAHGRALAQLAL